MILFIMYVVPMLFFWVGILLSLLYKGYSEWWEMISISDMTIAFLVSITPCLNLLLMFIFLGSKEGRVHK